MKTFIRRGYRFIKRKDFEVKQIIDYITHKNIFVFGAPYHSNAGDQAQTFCIEQWLKKNYSGYRVRIIDTSTATANDFKLVRTIRKHIKENDLIFLHSGYHTTDLYMLEENLQRIVIQLFANKRIVVLPQTIYYQDVKEEEKAKGIYNAHKKMLFLCRDKVSYEKAQSIFPNLKTILFPDIVTTMIGKEEYNYKRKGILLCTRNDKEARITSLEKANLIKALENIDTVEQTDTTLPITGNQFSAKRESILKDEWDKYAHYRVVITDRYHGTIFSLIANTPVIVMPSTDHKLESGVRWFPDSFSDYVMYAPDLSRIPELVREIFGIEYDYSLPPYFENEYYSKLKSIIEEVQ